VREEVIDMDTKRIQGAVIRFGWTFLLAFLAQPIVATFFDHPFKVTWQETSVAAGAALVYAIKKFVFPDTTL
jgi:hypothetical protein